MQDKEKEKKQEEEEEYELFSPFELEEEVELE